MVGGADPELSVPVRRPCGLVINFSEGSGDGDEKAACLSQPYPAHTVINMTWYFVTSPCLRLLIQMLPRDKQESCGILKLIVWGSDFHGSPSLHHPSTHPG